MLTVLITFATLLGLVIFYIVHVRPYLERNGYVRAFPLVSTARDRLCIFVRHSVTILWGWVKVLGGAAIGIVVSVADFLGDPSVQANLREVFTPKTVAIGLIAIGALTIFARMRTAKAEPE